MLYMCCCAYLLSELGDGAAKRLQSAKAWAGGLQRAVHAARCLVHLHLQQDGLQPGGHT